MNKKRRTGIYIVTALVCLLTLAGCGRKYEPVEVPTLEEASGDITLENGEETAAVSIENETGNGKNGTEKPGGPGGDKRPRGRCDYGDGSRLYCSG